MMIWERVGTLGKGSSGTVFLVHSKQQQQVVEKDGNSYPTVMAMKSAEASDSRSLRLESKFLNTFAHCPHIIRYFGSMYTVDDNGVDFHNILLEYASHGSLVDRLRDTREFPYHQIRKHTKSILLGLNYIHKIGYVHCDIKPENILLVMEQDNSTGSNGVIPRLKREVAKIADFGSVKEIGKKVRCLRGTALYLAPESAASLEYEPHSDVWALGCTVLQMITRRLPWLCGRDIEVMNLVYAIGQTDHLPHIPSWVPAEAADFLRKCLIRDVWARWTVDMLPFNEIAPIRIICIKCSIALS